MPSLMENTLATLRTSKETAFVLDAEDRFIYCNPAWDTFAAENGGGSCRSLHVLGTDLFRAIPAVLEGFFRERFSAVRSNGLTWSHVYECSSPQTFRKFRMLVRQGAEPGSLLITNTLCQEGEHTRPQPAGKSLYVTPAGVVTICAHCRCSKRIGEQVWDFVPSFLKEPPSLISHGLCPTCASYHYYDGFGQESS